LKVYLGLSLRISLSTYETAYELFMTDYSSQITAAADTRLARGRFFK